MPAQHSAAVDGGQLSALRRDLSQVSQKGCLVRVQELSDSVRRTRIIPAVLCGRVTRRILVTSWPIPKILPNRPRGEDADEGQLADESGSVVSWSEKFICLFFLGFRAKEGDPGPIPQKGKQTRGTFSQCEMV